MYFDMKIKINSLKTMVVIIFELDDASFIPICVAALAQIIIIARKYRGFPMEYGDAIESGKPSCVWAPIKFYSNNDMLNFITRLGNGN